MGEPGSRHRVAAHSHSLPRSPGRAGLGPGPLPPVPVSPAEACAQGPWKWQRGWPRWTAAACQALLLRLGTRRGASVPRVSQDALERAAVRAVS